MGKLRFMAPERPDMSYELSVLSQHLSSPTLEHLHRAKRLVRYVLATKDSKLVLEKKDGAQSVMHIDVFADSDHAGDVTTRRSVSCGVVFVNSSLVHIHSRRQTVVSTSSAEAELYAACGAAQEGLLLRTLCQELNLPCTLSLHSDASAARAIMTRYGLGKMKHVSVKYLWLQEQISRKVIALKKVKTEENPADIGTKRLSSARLRMLAEKCGMTFTTPSSSSTSSSPFLVSLVGLEGVAGGRSGGGAHACEGGRREEEGKEGKGLQAQFRGHDFSAGSA